MVIIVTALGSVVGGIVIGGYGIQHPLDLVGQCPPPLVIRSDQCYRPVTSTILVNGKNSTTTSYQLAGTITYLNGTVYGG